MSERNELAQAVAEERERNRRLRAVDLEAWLDRLQPFTFATRLVPLSQAAARAVVAAYGADGALDDIVANEPVLADLRAAVAATLADAGWPAGAFAKLSSRSPKDSTHCEAKAFVSVVEQLEAAEARGERPLATNTVFRACMSAGIAALRCASADDVLRCFLTSDRVCADDLPLALEHAHTAWTQHIVLREWIRIPTFCELRAFVVGNRLTALAQYFSGAFFPELLEHKEQMQALVFKLFSTIKPLLDLDPPDYVLDLAVDLPNRRVFVIELNPFGPPDGHGTGTPMFDLRNNAHDRAVLFGEQPFEFRIQTEPPTQSLKSLLHDGPLQNWLKERGHIR